VDTCPSEDELTLFLSGEDADAIALHIRQCGRCQQVLERLSDDEALRSASFASGQVAWNWGDPTELSPIVEALRGQDPSRSRGDLAANLLQRPVALDAPRVPGSVGSLGPYDIEAEIGHGGMGVVYRARDRNTGRRVALKVLFAGNDDERARRRFVQEVRAAAGVDHDHIVRLYATSDPADPIPYFVMEYVAGPSLAELISSRVRIAPREAADLVAQAATGVQAAHGAGLIHSDIKPANILIDPATGRAKVGDFGLARRENEAARLSREGLLPGTPAYLSPEQARGESTPSPRSDIYGLGVTLYECLTGEPPFLGKPHRIIHQVLSDEPRPPRRINPAVPADLETICLKAMAKDPSRRYASPADLAADLRRFLNGEPILARPAGVLERIWRFARRRPLIAAMAASLAVVSLAGFGGVVWQWRRAEAQRAQAEHNFREARRLVDAFYTRAYTEGLLSRPGLESLRRELFRDLLGYYRGFLRQRRDDPALQADLAEACFRVGTLTAEHGDKADAIEAFRQAESLFRAAVRRDPADRGARMKQAQCLDHLALAETQFGRWDVALGGHEQASDLLRELVEEAPRDRMARSSLARSLGHVANSRSLLHDTPGARRAYRDVVRILEELVAEEPSVSGHRDDLALTYNNMAMREEDPRAVAQDLRRALEIREQLLAQDPTNLYRRRNVARTCQNLGVAESEQGRQSEALERLERCCRLLEEVVRVDPTNSTYQCDLAQGYVNWSDVLGRSGRLDESVRSARQAREIYERLLTIQPGFDTARTGLISALVNVSESLVRKGRLAEATESTERAVKIARERAGERPEDGERQGDLAVKLIQLADVYRKLGRSADAEGSEREAQALRPRTGGGLDAAGVRRSSP
jgi:tetratricopeptide (TPR) repeat protein